MTDATAAGWHDRGGVPTDEPVNPADHPLEDWELLTEAIAALLVEKGIRDTHVGRRVVDHLPQQTYETLGYYERWVAGIEQILTEKSIIRSEEVDRMVSDG